MINGNLVIHEATIEDQMDVLKSFFGYLSTNTAMARTRLPRRRENEILFEENQMMDNHLIFSGYVAIAKTMMQLRSQGRGNTYSESVYD